MKEFIVRTKDRKAAAALAVHGLPELIRCKDCKSYVQHGNRSFCGEFRIESQPEDYCSRGVRKDE